jgi:nucleoside-diphosphate-sugar epimerase
VFGLARRVDDPTAGKPQPPITLAAADVGRDDLAPLFRGADAVVHLAWAIQPSHDEATLWRTNVVGSHRVFRAAADAGVETVIHASSIGAYSAARPGRVVDETWPVEGTPSSFYARHKAGIETFLDGFEAAHPSITVVRMRPASSVCTAWKVNPGIVGNAGINAGRSARFGNSGPRNSLRIPVAAPRLKMSVAAAIHAALKRGAGGAFNLASGGAARSVSAPPPD